MVTGLARAVSPWGLLLAAVMAAGCGGNNMAEVRGTVTVDDAPVALGAITFYPIQGKTTTAGGRIKNGQYAVQVPLGEMKVVINVPKKVGSKPLYDTPNSRVRDVIEESLPARYSDPERTELRLDVNGAMEKNFDDLRTK
jgi:hypothetical protein